MTSTTEGVKSAFGAAKDRALQEVAPGGPFLSADEKATIYRSGTAFWLVDARSWESKEYGARVQFVVSMTADGAKHGDYNTENTRTLDFGSSPVREKLAEELAPILAAQGVIGPLYLERVPTAKGNPAWDITDEPPAPEDHGGALDV